MDAPITDFPANAKARAWAARLKPLPVCLALALLIRLVPAICLKTSYTYDELFQYLEQAHNLVFGPGVVSWEYQVGLRSLLIPLLLAGPMKLAALAGASPLSGLVLVRILLSVASLSIVWCAVRWGEVFQGRQGAWLAGLLVAIWPDFWLIAPHPLEESLSAYTLLPALHFALRSRLTPHWRHICLSGILLGLSFALREQLAPSIAIIGIYLGGRAPRSWLLGMGAALLPVLAAGMLDWLSWGMPFRSFWMNLYLNMSVGISDGFFGKSSIAYYPLNLLYPWLWSIIPLFWLGWYGARKFPVAALAAAAILIEHSLFAHKELRFVFPAIALLVPLAGIGLAQVWPRRSQRGRALILAALLTGPYVTPYFFMMVPWQDSAFNFYTSLARYRPRLVAIEAWDRGFLPIFPVFPSGTAFTDATGRDAADAIVAEAGHAQIPPGFTLRKCVRQSWIPFQSRKPDFCFWTRAARTCPAQSQPPFVLVYPPQARKFIVRDKFLN